MKLWSVGMGIDGMGEPIRKVALLRAVGQIREFGPGTLTGTNNSMFNVVFAADAAEDMDDLITGIRLRMKAEGVGDIPVYACELPRDTDWTEMGRMLGIDADALKAAATACYVGNELPKAARGEVIRDVIELAAHVEGIDEAIYRLKILEAQLHGVQSMAAKVGKAIDNLQLKLENRIATLARPDR